VATPSDQQLIQYIQQGRREAVAQLFDRYSADLYDFLARLVGDRDQAARLLEEVFMRVPGAVAGLPPRESVRGALYSLAREAGLNWLRQKGSLDTLPPSDEPVPPGLGGEIWQAARAMPGFHRAVLIVEELHALSPTEKARALGVQRTDLARLVEEARKSFTRAFDAQARAEGRPTSAQIDPERILGLRRRISAPDTSLFSFLPVLVMPDSLQQALRQRIIQAVSGQPLRPIEGPPTPPPPEPPLEAEAGEPIPEAAREESPPEIVVTTTRRARIPLSSGFMGVPLPTRALAAGAGIALAVVICAVVYFLFFVNLPPPVIDRIDPPDGASVPQAPATTILVAFHDPRGIDTLRLKLAVDGTDVSTLATVSDTGMAYSGPLGMGSHTVTATIFNRAGKQTDKTWSFTVVPAPTPTPTLAPAATPPLPTATPFATQTLTPSPTSTPSRTSTATSTASPTLCLTAISGTAFNDLNGNQVRDGGEPTLSGVVVNLQNGAGSTLATAISDSFGTYKFASLPFGTYRVQAAVPPGWYPTTPTLITVNLSSCGASLGVDFGFNQATPTPLPTTPPTQTPIIIVITPTPTNSPLPTNTPTNTPTSTLTNTPVPPTATSTPTSTTTPTGPTNTPTATSTPTATTSGFVVTNVTASVTPTSSTTCPQTFNFTGSITVNAPGTVQYQWVRSDGSSGAVHSLTFLVPGTQSVLPDSWFIPGASPFNFSGWEELSIVVPVPTPTPVPTLSGTPPNRANFTLMCP
jgi:DNA-directed RNA polymerase specialized sigma24 family protein